MSRSQTEGEARGNHSRWKIQQEQNLGTWRKPGVLRDGEVAGVAAGQGVGLYCKHREAIGGTQPEFHL